MSTHNVYENSELILKPYAVLEVFLYVVFVLSMLQFIFQASVKTFNFFLCQVQNIFLLEIYFLCSFLDEFFEAIIGIHLLQHTGQILRNCIELCHWFEEKNRLKLKIIKPIIYLTSYWTRTFSRKMIPSGLIWAIDLKFSLWYINSVGSSSGLLPYIFLWLSFSFF